MIYSLVDKSSAAILTLIALISLSCSNENIVGDSGPMIDFEGDVTKFNEPCRDSILFASDRGMGISMIFKDGTGIHDKSASRYPYLATWSPRKWKIFYVSDSLLSGNARTLYVMNVDGSSLQKISQTSENVWWAACAPDGQKIAYVVHNDFGEGKIRIAKPDGTEAHDISGFILSNQSPVITWSPDSRQIAFDWFQSDDIGVANADGSQVGPLFLPAPSKGYYNPNWSPDGSKVAYVAYTWVQDGQYSNVFYYDKSTQKHYQVTSLRGAAFTPHWSLDGRQIVFSLASMDRSSSNLYIVNVDGTELVQLTSGTHNDSYPDW
jgi:Tol biopolymer transport system component